MIRFRNDKRVGSFNRKNETVSTKNIKVKSIQVEKPYFVSNIQIDSSDFSISLDNGEEILTLSDVGGVELLQDNTEECRERLFEQWNAEYEIVCKSACNDEMREVIRFILSRNILCGNALTLKQVDANAKDTETPIIFSEWEFIDDKVKRRDFRLDKMLKSSEETEKEKVQFSLFRDLDDMEYDKTTKSWIPKPIREFEPINYKLAAQQKEVHHV